MISKALAHITAMMLDMAMDEMGERGCREITLDNTPENFEFVKGMINCSERPDYEPSLDSDEAKIFCVDIEVMEHCKRLLLEEV